MTKEKAEILFEALSKLGMKPIMTTHSPRHGEYYYTVDIDRGSNYLISFDTSGVTLMKWSNVYNKFYPDKEIEWDMPPEKCTTKP